MQITKINNGDTAWEFSLVEVKALLAHASKDHTRPYLASICLDGPRRAAVATDGHRLAICYATEGAPELAKEPVVPRALMEQACKAASKHARIVVSLHDEQAHVEVRSMHAAGGPPTGEVIKLSARLVDVAFPPIDHVIPKARENAAKKGTGTNRIGFNARYLADLVLVATAAETIKLRVILQPPEDPFGPARIEVEGSAGKWLVILMPMKH